MSYKLSTRILMYEKIVFLILKLRIVGLNLVFLVPRMDFKIKINKINWDGKI